MRKLIIRLYSSAANARGRSPLDLPERAVWITFALAFMLTVIVGNLFVRGLYRSALSSLNNGGADISLSDRATGHDARVAELTNLKAVGKEMSDDLRLGDLFSQNSIQYTSFERWMADRRQISSDQLRLAIMGRLDGWLFPVAQPMPNESILRSFGFEKPNTSELHNIQPADWDYYITAACLDKFRKNLSGGYHQPLRLASALAGSIQWLTFFLAIWGGILLICRFVFSRIQRQLIQTGKNPVETEEKSSLWQVEGTDPESPPLYVRLQDKLPALFLPADLLAQCMHAGVLTRAPHELQEYIGEKVAEFKAKVESSEFELVDFIIYACPTLGFLGTIVGITEAFAKAAEIISSTSTLARIEAFNRVTEALALAFDTSFVGLLAVLILNQMLSLLKRREAGLFIELETETFVQMRRLQRVKQNAYSHAR